LPDEMIWFAVLQEKGRSAAFPADTIERGCKGPCPGAATDLLR